MTLNAALVHAVVRCYCRVALRSLSLASTVRPQRKPQDGSERSRCLPLLQVHASQVSFTVERSFKKRGISRHSKEDEEPWLVMQRRLKKNL